MEIMYNVFSIKRSSMDEAIPEWYGFFHRGTTDAKDHCDSIINWEKSVDIEGFSESEHSDMFTGDKRFPSSRCRTTLLEVLEDLGLCLYDLFPNCKSPLKIHSGVLRALRNVDMDFVPLPVNDSQVWFIERRKYYESEGEMRQRWMRITEQEMLEAVGSGDIVLDTPLCSAARTVFGKKGADWTAFEINENPNKYSKMNQDFRFNLYFANDTSRLMSIEWTGEVSQYADHIHLSTLCDSFKACMSAMPPPDTDTEGKPIDILHVNWKNKVRRDYRTYYPLYLKSADWYLVRQVFFMRSECNCANLGCEAEATQIHHASYMNVACEKIGDLLPLCKVCHAYLHKKIGVLETSDVVAVQQRHENREPSEQPQDRQIRLPILLQKR